MKDLITEEPLQKKVWSYDYYTIYTNSSDGVISVTTKKNNWYNEHLKSKKKRKLECSKQHFRRKIWKII